MVGLDICGVDVVCESVLQPLEEQSGGIVEVNAAPGLRMHLSPPTAPAATSAGRHRPHVPNGGNGRIPVVAVTGTNGKTTTVRLIAHLLRTQGLRVGMTNTDGVYVNGRQIDSGDCSARAARATCWPTPTSTPPCWRPRAAACCARAWASTAATWPWSPTARATTWA
jgi:cyanophycin synthetase